MAAAAAVGLLGVWVFADDTSEVSELPAPRKVGKMSLEESLTRRRSIRRFSPEALSRQQIAQLCWAGQGVTDSNRGFRTSPSAGALYPLELYVVTAEGVERYIPQRHAMEKHMEGDLRPKLQAAALDQSCVGQAPAVFVVTGVVSRTAQKYGRRAMRYVLIEVGHVSQNLLLQATAMGLGTVPVGAMREEEVSKILSLPADHTPLFLIPIGAPQK